MNQSILTTSVLITLLFTLMLIFSLPALADKPSSIGKQGNSWKNYKKGKDNKRGNGHSYSHDKNEEKAPPCPTMLSSTTFSPYLLYSLGDRQKGIAIFTWLPTSC